MVDCRHCGDRHTEADCCFPQGEKNLRRIQLLFHGEAAYHLKKPIRLGLTLAYKDSSLDGGSRRFCAAISGAAQDHSRVTPDQGARLFCNCLSCFVTVCLALLTVGLSKVVRQISKFSSRFAQPQIPRTNHEHTKTPLSHLPRHSGSHDDLPLGGETLRPVNASSACTDAGLDRARGRPGRTNHDG